MIQAPEFWVLVAFIIFVGFAFRPASKTFVALLDDRAEKIRAELEEAQRLREEAQATLAHYQRKQRDALKEAEDIIAHAREEADRLRQQAAADLEASLKRREAQALDKIAQTEAQAVAEVRNMTVDLAITASRKLLAENLDDKKASKLIDEAIADLPKHLH